LSIVSFMNFVIVMFDVVASLDLVFRVDQTPISSTRRRPLFIPATAQVPNLRFGFHAKALIEDCSSKIVMSVLVSVSGFFFDVVE